MVPHTEWRAYDVGIRFDLAQICSNIAGDMEMEEPWTALFDGRM